MSYSHEPEVVFFLLIYNAVHENLGNGKSLLPVGVRSSKTAYRLCLSKTKTAISINVIERNVNKPESRNGKVKWVFYSGALARTKKL